MRDSLVDVMIVLTIAFSVVVGALQFLGWCALQGVRWLLGVDESGGVREGEND